MPLVKCLTAITVGFALVLMLLAGNITFMTSGALAAVHEVDESAGIVIVDDEGTETASNAAASASAAAASAASDKSASAQETETIEDEDNPLSDGLGGGEPALSQAGAGIQWVVIAGIIAVVAFFAVKTHRLNSSINKMKDTFR